jgi:hypothetical protein
VEEDLSNIPTPINFELTYATLNLCMQMDEKVMHGSRNGGHALDKLMPGNVKERKL